LAKISSPGPPNVTLGREVAFGQIAKNGVFEFLNAFEAQHLGSSRERTKFNQELLVGIQCK
jgi:hypothetical protein